MPNMLKQPCEMFLSLPCLQRGGISDEEVILQGRPALSSGSTHPAGGSVWHRKIFWCNLKPEMEVPRPGSSGLGCAEVTSSTITAFESNFVWFNVQHALLRLGTIISIYSQKPGELFVKRQSDKSSTVCKIQTFVLQVKYLDRNHYWVLLQQPCQRKREREGWERKHKGGNNIWLAKQLENWWGIVKPIKASCLSLWVTFCSGKRLPTEELLVNITLRTCLLLVTLQYPLLEWCVSENSVTCLQGLIDNSRHSTSWVRFIPSAVPGEAVAVRGGWIFCSCPLSFCVFSRLRLLQWPESCRPCMHSVN